MILILICALVLGSSLCLLREALHALLEGTPAHLSVVQIGLALAATARVRSVFFSHLDIVIESRRALCASCCRRL